MKRLFLLLFCILVLANGYAQRTKVYGTVRTAEGKPVEMANVRIQGTALLTLTDLKGRYTLFCESKDSVVVVFSQIGYSSRRHLLRNPGDSVKVDAVLHEATNTLGTADVVGMRRQNGSMQDLKTDQLDFMPSTTGNAVEELVQAQAGVSTHNELSSQYNVRGGSFDENVVYLNGIEIYRPMLVRSGQQEGLSIINPDMVQRIRFSSGGYEARYGDKMSSVLDITYKKPEHFEAKISADLLGAGAYIGWGNKHVSLMSSVRYKTTGYLLGSLDTEAEYKPRFLDYQAYFSWRPSPKWELELLGNISDNNYKFVPKNRETSFGTMLDPKTFTVYFDGQEKDFYRTYFGSASVTRHFNPNTFLSLQLSTFTTQEHETYDIQGEYWLQEATAQEQMGIGTYMEHARNRLKAHVYNAGLRFGTKTGANREKTNTHTLLAGFNFQHQSINENAREWEMRDSTGYSLPYSADVLRLIYSLRSQNDISANRIEVFAQDSWRKRTNAGLFDLTYGLRFTYLDWNKECLISPRANISFMPAKNDHWTIRFATGIYYQAPFYKELRDTTLQNGIATVQLNRDIKSQRSIHFVLGGDYTFTMFNRPFKFTAEAYYKALSNLNPYSVNNLRIIYYGRNIASGYATGVDFKLFGEFVPGVDSWLTFSLMQTQEKIDGIKIPRPTDQRYNISLFFSDYFPGSTRWRASLKLVFAGGLPFGPPHTERAKQTFRAPAYKRMDLDLSYLLLKYDAERRHSGIRKAVKNIWLGVDFFNLLGISNVNSYYWVTDISNTQYAVPNYLTGRRVSARLTFEF
ncbi:MAG: TonB-dependent receptor plug domain-containing protein [Alloprevotella sp.]|nr:TonB-dependent receptor plug domain-containing protein [Alloprevotella sp.]